MSSSDFLHTTLGRTGIPVHRLGFSASYRPGKQAVRRAFDEGINLFFGFGIDTQMTSVLRDLFRTERDKCVLATGAYNFIWGYPNLRRTLEKRCRQFGTGYIDLFLFLGVMKEKEFPHQALEEMLRFREEGKVRAIGISCHDRKLIGRLADEGILDVMMLRYNAAHRGAETDIFPHLALHDPGVIGYTATRWTYLTRRPKGYPSGDPLPAPADAYRFVLTNPHVHCCLTAPRSEKQLLENLAAVRKGPLTPEEMAVIQRLGDFIHYRRKWFM